MARKIKPPDALPSKAWLMSFGDTMTTLLAFFIVLCSMAEDQTGANLHAGTGSFIKTLKSAGLPGAFSGDKSVRAIHLQATNPLYLLESHTDREAVPNGNGPDADPNDLPTKDRESDEFKRFLNEIERIATVTAQPETTGEITLDFFQKLSNEPPHLPSNYDDILARVIPFLRKSSHRIEVVVWATTPSQSARTRAARQSSRIAAHLVSQAGLSPKNNRRILGSGRAWPYRDSKRPVVSLVIRRVAQPF